MVQQASLCRHTEESFTLEKTPDTASAPPGNSSAARARNRQVRLRSPRFYLMVSFVLYGMILAVITLANAIGPDRWWLSGLNLYLPQWLWGLPGLLLTVATFKIAWRAAWFPLLCLLWVAGPLMGFCWGTSLSADAAAGKPALRVMTYNIKYGRGDINAIIDEITNAQPDLLMIQDAAETMRGPLGIFLKSWNVRTFGQYIIASKLPLSRAEVRWISFPGAPHTCLRCRLTISSRSVTVYDVHLLTPRQGLSAIKSEGDDGVSTLEDNITARLYQAKVLAEMLQKEQGPLIAAGDLNAPDSSIVCKMLAQAGLHDAFSEAGQGYGYTYGHALRLRHSFMRIDHLLLSPDWRAQHCRTGGSEGSAHRPVIADLILQ